MKKIFIGITFLIIAVSLISFEKDKKSADTNDSIGIFNLGSRYMNGKDVAKDMEKAQKLFLKSANMGYANAQYNVGICYLKGIAVKQNYHTSLKWMEMAVKQNLPEAYYVIGWQYENGKGVEEDIYKAFEYYIKAAELGDKKSLERITKEVGEKDALKKVKKQLLKKQNNKKHKHNKLWREGKRAHENGYYQSSIDYYQKSLTLRKKLFGEKHPKTMDTYHAIGMVYNSMEDYPKAIEYFQKALTLREKVLGEKHPRTITTYHNIGMMYRSMENYPKALECFKKVLDISKKALEKKDPKIVVSHINICRVYKSMEDYPKALECFKKVLDISKKALGKEHPATSSIYRELSFIYKLMENHPMELAYHQKYWTATKNKLDKENLDNATFYKFNGYGSIKNGHYQTALDYLTMAMIITERIKGKEHSNTADIYNDIGEAHYSKGDYHKALGYLQKSLSIREKVLGKEHRNTISSYNNIGTIYQEMGDYQKALEYLQKTVILFKKTLGKEHIETATSYNNIGQLYQSMGDYQKSLEYYKKSLSARKKVKRKKYTGTADSYNNIGTVYGLLGNYQKALEHYKKALKIYKRVLGKEHPRTALVYNNIAGSYHSLEDYQKALKYSQMALKIREKKLGEEHPLTASSYSVVGLIHESMKNYPKAIIYLQMALTIREKKLGSEHSMTADSYINLGVVYSSMGDYSNSLVYNKKALAIYEKALGKEHPNISETYNNIGVTYASMKNYLQAHQNAQIAFNIFLKNRDKVFAILDSKQKDKYLKSTSDYISGLLSSSYYYMDELKTQNKTQKLQQVLYSGANAWLNYKGSIFDSENAIAMFYNSTKDEKLKAKINDLVSSKRFLAKLYQSLPKPKERESWKNNIKNTEGKIAKLTNEISSKASSFKKQQGLKSINYKDITSHLDEDELYIDYAKAGDYYYLFTLEHKENIEFVQIDKNSTKKIDNLVKTFREDVNTILNDTKIPDGKLKQLTQSSKEKLSKLYELVIKKPLENQLETKTSLILSPDGALRLLPFEALYNKEKGKYFIEEKEIRYIPSGKELVRLYKYSKDKKSKTKKSAVIFANPNFDTKIASTSKEQIAFTPNTSRSGIIKSLFRMRFDPLPGTKAEAKAIKTTLNQKSISEYQTDKATESKLMKIKEPKILHIATHGFFINDDSIPNPMLKSGIALAGANTSAIKGKSDGIVTALKLSGLDLKGTDLVVLSACQTGVVDINSTDSVSGLSKAFIQAGAKDIVMSLWSVDDEATKDLMSSFYEEMKENKNYAKALKTAKLKMIADGRHPFYWAAFVVSGL